MLDCLVVGGGQFGLVCGHLLGQTGIQYLVVDDAARIGEVWRRRPRNLKLFTSRQFCRLGNLEMPGDPESYASGQEFADHLENFAREAAIVLRQNVRVNKLRRIADGFEAEMSDGSLLQARTVINASGANQAPNIPTFATNLAPELRQVAAGKFQDIHDFNPGSRLLVVGDGASGRQIADELAGHHRVTLACGRVRKLMPNRLFGHDIFWWLTRLGVVYASPTSLIGKIIRKRDPIPVASISNKNLQARGVVLKPRAVDGSGYEIGFADGSREAFDGVIWCGGYREDSSWLELSQLKNDAALTQEQGRTAEPGFFVVGRKWLSCRASELVLGLERDSRRVTGYVSEYLQNTGRPAA